MKFTPDVDFTNISQKAFFVLLGSARVKTAHKTLMKLTPSFSPCVNHIKTIFVTLRKKEFIR